MSVKPGSAKTNKTLMSVKLDQNKDWQTYVGMSRQRKDYQDFSLLVKTRQRKSNKTCAVKKKNKNPKN